MSLSIRRLFCLSAASRIVGAKSRPSSSGKRFSPRLENLEDRFAPATLRVGPGESIQAAVDLAHAGDTIRVAGTHVEQVLIASTPEHNLDNLTIVGVGGRGFDDRGHGGHEHDDDDCDDNDRSRATIQAPATMTSSVIEVRGAQNVSIKHLNILGPSNGTSDLFFGIEVDGGGSANIVGNHIRGIADNPLSGAQRGIAIYVHGASADVANSANISGNLIDHYQKGGIYVDGLGASANILRNRVIGAGQTAIIAQNGIQVSHGATAEIRNNFISQNLYTPQTFTAVGILLDHAGIVSVVHNTLWRNDVGVFALNSPAQTLISKNSISFSTAIGIDLDGTTGARIAQNELFRNGSGRHGATNDAGIALFGSTNNIIDRNESTRNRGDGIFVDAASTGNTLTNNRFYFNDFFDAEDLSSGMGTGNTANQWRNNRGRTSNPSGLVTR